MTRFKMLLGAAAVAALAAAPTFAQEVKLGALLEITGPIASAVPPILDAAKLVEKHVNDNGGILTGRQVRLTVLDGQGTPQGAVDAATKLVNIEQAPIIVGPLMSGSLMASANSVTIPAKVAIISPSATSPAITGLADGDTVFRTAPSDLFQGRVMAQIALDKGIKTVAMTYINNDYGVGMARAFKDAFEAKGGKVTYFEAHEAKKAAFRTELATAARDKPQALALVALPDDTGVPIIRQALEGGFFDTFLAAEGMRIPKLIADIGADNLKKAYFSAPAAPTGAAIDRFRTAYKAAYPNGNPDGLFVPQMYDAAFMAALAIQAAGSTDRTAIRDGLRKISAAGGEAILPGEWKKAVDALKAGKAISYQGASGPKTFDAAGDVPGVFGEYAVQGNEFKLVRTVAP